MIYLINITMLPPIAQLVERETVAVTQRISLGPWFESGWVDLLEPVRQLTSHTHSRVYSSVVEQLIAAQQVGGSNPPAPLYHFFWLPVAFMWMTPTYSWMAQSAARPAVNR